MTALEPHRVRWILIPGSTLHDGGFYRRLHSRSSADFLHRPSSVWRDRGRGDSSVFASDRLLSARILSVSQPSSIRDDGCLRRCGLGAVRLHFPPLEWIKGVLRDMERLSLLRVVVGEGGRRVRRFDGSVPPTSQAAS